MPLERPRTKDVFEQVYDVLVKHAGARESGREDFIQMTLRWSERDPYKTQEYRFMGALGGGGKFWLSPECFRVSAYNEDYNKERLAMIAETNVNLADLFVPPERCSACDYERKTGQPARGPHDCDPLNEEEENHA